MHYLTTSNRNSYLSKTRIYLRTALACAIALPCSLAFSDVVLEEIIVTAQKRAQNTQDVPISLTALSSDKLAKAGIDSVKSLDTIAPGLGFTSSLSSAGEGVRVRGIGSAGFNTGVEQSVSVIIDGVVTGSSGSGLSTLWDVERVEVLRGPQGTLFGKNASAGAINVTSKRGSDFFEAEFVLQYEAEYEGLKANAAVGGPLSDKLTGRLAAFSLNQGKGYVDNILTGDTTNQKEQWGIRASLDYEGEDWSAKFTLAQDETNNECCTRTFRQLDLDSAGDLTLFILPSALARTGIEVGEDNRETINNNKMYERADTTHLALELEKELSSGHSLKSITGYRNWQHAEANDADVTDLDIIFSEQERELTVLTQELQLLSPTEGELEYVLGLYLFDQGFDEDSVLSGGSSLAPLGYGFGRTLENSHVEVENYAIFGHATYQINEQLHAYAGARILYEKITAEGIRYGDPVVGALFAFPGNLPGGKVSGDDTNGVGTLGIQYYTDQGNMLYAKVARGYKGAAIDTSFDSDLYRGDPDNIALLEPEQVISVEAGSKSYFFDRKLSVDIGFYMSQFKDFQTSAFDGNKVAFVLRNAGDVETRGFELDLAATPWDGGLLNLYLTYTDAEFAKYEGAPCTVPDKALGICDPLKGGQDLSGEKVNDTPEWKYTLVMQQNISFGNNVSAYVRGQYTWRDEVIKSGDLDINTFQEAYGIASFRVGVMPGDEWEINAFVDNAFDEDYALQIFDAPLFEGAYSQYKAPRRTYGIETRFQF
jgi:iron complex outermembrane recepter protein